MLHYTRTTGRSKDFPLSLANKLQEEERIDQTIHSHIRRLKRVQSDKHATNNIYTNFLKLQNNNINGYSWTYYNYDPFLTREETMARLKQFLLWYVL